MLRTINIKVLALLLCLVGTGLAQNKINLATQVTGTLPAANGGTGVTNLTFSGSSHKVASVSGSLTNTHCVNIDASGNLTDAGAACGTGAGSVSSVGLIVPSPFSVSGSPVTGSSSFTVTWGSGQIPVANLGTGTASAIGRGTVRTGQAARADLILSFSLSEIPSQLTRPYRARADRNPLRNGSATWHASFIPSGSRNHTAVAGKVGYQL